MQVSKPLETHIQRVDPDTGEVRFFANITKNELRKGGYYVVGYQSQLGILATSNLSRAALKLAFWLMANADWSDEIDAPQTHVAKALKTDRATISKAFKELEQLRFIYRTKRYNRIVYTLNPNFATKGRKRDAKVAMYEGWKNDRAEELAAAAAAAEADELEADRIIAMGLNKLLPVKERIDIDRIDKELAHSNLR